MFGFGKKKKEEQRQRREQYIDELFKLGLESRGETVQEIWDSFDNEMGEYTAVLFSSAPNWNYHIVLTGPLIGINQVTKNFLQILAVIAADPTKNFANTSHIRMLYEQYGAKALLSSKNGFKWGLGETNGEWENFNIARGTGGGKYDHITTIYNNQLEPFKTHVLPTLDTDAFTLFREIVQIGKEAPSSLSEAGKMAYDALQGGGEWMTPEQAQELGLRE